MEKLEIEGKIMVLFYIILFLTLIDALTTIWGYYTLTGFYEFNPLARFLINFFGNPVLGLFIMLLVYSTTVYWILNKYILYSDNKLRKELMIIAFLFIIGIKLSVIYSNLQVLFP